MRKLEKKSIPWDVETANSFFPYPKETCLTVFEYEGPGSVNGTGALIITGELEGVLDGEQIVIDGNVILDGHTTLSGNISLTPGSSLTSPSGYDVISSANIDNQGIWSVDTNLTGSDTRVMTGTFGGDFYLNESLGITGSPVFDQQFYFQGFTLTVNAPDTLTIAEYEGAGILEGGGLLTITSKLEGDLTANQVNLQGAINVDGWATWHADVNLVSGSLESTGGYEFQIAGNIVNNGTWTVETFVYWDPIAGADSYDFNITDSFPTWPDPVNQFDNRYEVTAIIDQSRSWRVRDVTGGVAGDWSEVKTIN